MIRVVWDAELDEAELFGKKGILVEIITFDLVLRFEYALAHWKEH